MASDNSSTDTGFTRPEMYTEKLAGTVDAYDRHVFLYYKNHLSWPPRVEASDDHPLPKLVADTFKARKNDLALKTKITVCEASEEDGFSDGDVLIFPEMVKYRGLVESNVESFFEDVLVNDKPWAIGVPEVLTGSHVYVCAHGSRDVRCGTCGPVLIKNFNEEIELRGLKDQISVTACSHLGGHKYAGNIIIYSPGPDGKTMGHWYGYVTPNDIPDLLDQHIAKGEVIQRLWRGQMGPSVPEVKGANDQKLANGNLANGEHANKIEKNIESNSLSREENVTGCCQGVNGVSCCSFPNPAKRDEIKEGKSCKIRSLLKERDVLTAVGVLGAGAAVAVAYKLYRRSG
ncbi:putative thioredoxin-like ferredoxin [Medicago truncatula]|uniref:Putative thioredoxin-like ferredoxin n=1 Tax=Medicago truncatula TaxID=3880 RepID=B7FK85_MEDTR|nr:altered inheritance of mitochondria protein 32 [Medicago truncatula]ACJ85170.1 unknown [Medicago truncatula]KEH22139.1 sucrase/ferredoxin family protein [Medicago truncatula]RHN45158.1 putative thioredoxin-like ferredoxin [Medicago truncatula]